MDDKEAATASIENPLASAMYMARIAYLDQLLTCPAQNRSGCTVCSKFGFLSDHKGNGFYYLPFATDEEAVQWSLTGHVRHQLIDISDGRLVPLTDNMFALERQKVDLEAGISSQFAKVLDALPDWDSDID